MLAALGVPRAERSCGNGMPPCPNVPAAGFNPLGLCAVHLERYRAALTGTAPQTQAAPRADVVRRIAVRCPHCGPGLAVLEELIATCTGCGTELRVCRACGLREVLTYGGGVHCRVCGWRA
ncbi:hypothetical protein [Sorangium sp. So ce385]|uniref:hypothetical protein n=1 Tax=Sorangium sp. So ce385 TaxID=3133308 RepID=UPI003F5C7F8A